MELLRVNHILPVNDLLRVDRCLPLNQLLRVNQLLRIHHLLPVNHLLRVNQLLRVNDKPFTHQAPTYSPSVPAHRHPPALAHSYQSAPLLLSFRHSPKGDLTRKSLYLFHAGPQPQPTPEGTGLATPPTQTEADTAFQPAPAPTLVRSNVTTTASRLLPPLWHYLTTTTLYLEALVHSLPAAAPVGRASLEELHSVSQATSQADRLAQSLELALSHGLEPPPVDPDMMPRYPCGVWRWKHVETGITRPFACHSWKCPVCGWAKARMWCELISYAPIARHVVLTRLPGDRPVAKPLANIVKAIRRGEAVEMHAGRRRPRTFEYLATAEQHARAGVHVHLLQHGHYVDQRLLSHMLPRYGAGRVTWIERIAEPHRMTALTRYVTRHLIAWVHPYQPKVGPRVRYSRHFFGEGSTTDLRAALRSARFPEHTGPWILLRSDPDHERHNPCTPPPASLSPPPASAP